VGLLDDLERESAQRRAVGSPLPEESKAGLWTERLGPAVQRLYEYIKKLTAHLTFLKKRIRVSYSLPGYGDVIAYIDPVYSLKATPSNDSVEIVLECFAQVASDECPVLDVEGVVRVETLSSTFSKHRILGLQEGRKNANGDVVAGRFQARGRIPLRLLIEAGQGLGVARLTLSNFYGFATTIRSFTHLQLTDDLFDSLARYLTHEDASFAREQVDEDVRRTLAARVQREAAIRQWEQRTIEALREDETAVRKLGPGGWLIALLRR